MGHCQQHMESLRSSKRMVSSTEQKLAEKAGQLVVEESETQVVAQKIR